MNGAFKSAAKLLTGFAPFLLVPASVPQASPPSSEAIAANAEFQSAAMNHIRATDENFSCLQLMPYDQTDISVCDVNALAYQQMDGRYYLNAFYRSGEGYKLWQEIMPAHLGAESQLFHAAHEYKHFLDRDGLVARAVAEANHGNRELADAIGARLELAGDVYALAVMKAYRPQQYAEFAAHLIEFRRVEQQRMGGDHGLLLQFDLKALTVEATPKDLNALSALADRLVEGQMGVLPLTTVPARTGYMQSVAR